MNRSGIKNEELQLRGQRVGYQKKGVHEMEYMRTCKGESAAHFFTDFKLSEMIQMSFYRVPPEVETVPCSSRPATWSLPPFQPPTLLEYFPVVLCL